MSSIMFFLSWLPSSIFYLIGGALSLFVTYIVVRLLKLLWDVLPIA